MAPAILIATEPIAAPAEAPAVPVPAEALAVPVEPEVAEPAVAEPIAAEPIAAPVAAPASATYFIPEAPIQPVAETVEAEPKNEVKAKSDEPKSQTGYIASPVPFPGVAYFRAVPFAQPVYRPSPYLYGYNYGYPYLGTNYVYAL